MIFNDSFLRIFFIVSFSKTRKSSKSKRKQERKLMSLKEGGVYEDLGLMRVLHEIITNTYEQKGCFWCIILKKIYLRVFLFRRGWSFGGNVEVFGTDNGCQTFGI